MQKDILHPSKAYKRLQILKIFSIFTNEHFIC